MSDPVVNAVASPNIAFIKYWGNRDEIMRIPSNPSLSMTLGGLETSIQLSTLAPEQEDELWINAEPADSAAQMRTSAFMDFVREISDRSERAQIQSTSNYPIGAGIASSAAAFAAIAVAADVAYGIGATPVELSRLARRGSGSAARSIYGGYVEMSTGELDEDAYAQPLLPADHWDLEDWIVIVDSDHKPTGSTEGHALAETSPIQPARVADTPRRIQLCRQALEGRDFSAFAEVVEQDSNLMHAVMITSTPNLLYLQPGSLEIMRSVKRWRKDGIQVCFTVDAGPNVHVICTSESSPEVERRLRSISGAAELIHAVPGEAARITGQPVNPRR